MSARSSMSAERVIVTADTLGAFVRPWAKVAAEWHEAGVAQVKHSYVTEVLADCIPSTRISPLSDVLELSGVPARRGAIPMAYPRHLPPARAGSALALGLSMTHASTLCGEKLLSMAAASGEELPALMTVIAIVSAARMGAIEAFNSAPGAQNSDAAARYALDYSSTVSRVVLRSFGTNAAEDLWISAFRQNRKAPPAALPVLDIARKYGPLFVLLYAMISEPGATSAMGGMYANTVWASFVEEASHMDVDATAFILEPEWIKRAVIFETGRWLPLDALTTIAQDPAISTACMRRALTDPDAILASQEEEAHLRITARTAPVSPLAGYRAAHGGRPASPITTDTSEEAVAEDVFTSSTPAPYSREPAHSPFAFPHAPTRLANPAALYAVPHSPTTMVTPRPSYLPGGAEQQFRMFAAQAARDAAPAPNDRYAPVATPPPQWA